ncbi:MAG: glycosyltransferase [Planctomycetes bacterium]|nr:glycosyltransferase [Planctomycetota bacterium]
MKIAYISSGMDKTFITNEMGAHEQSGWTVLPFGSCKRHDPDKLSRLMAQWVDKAVFRPGAAIGMRSLLLQTIKHPIVLLRIVIWLVNLMFHSFSEFAKAVYELPGACYFAEKCSQENVQHIHIHFASRSLSLGLMIGMLVKRPVSCTVHAFDIFTRKPASLIPRLSKCSFIAAISEYNVEYLRKTCGDRIADLCRVVHCGIDVEQFKATDRDFQPGKLLFVGRLVEKKGLEVSIEAAARLHEEGISFSYDIVGNGPLHDDLEELIKCRGLQEKVRLLGSVPNDRLSGLSNRCAVFVMPCVRDSSGDQDGIPVALMEAMACEIPVVSTNISGIPELVEDGVNGCLADAKDVDGLAAALKDLLAAPPRHNRELGRAARRRIQEEFNITRTSCQLRELISGIHDSETTLDY